VRCANTGISFVVDPWGRVSHETEIFTAASFVAEIVPGAGSLAARYPDWVLLPPGLLLAAALLAGALRRGRPA
jgi:apolipoprotein N-acyltransferase